MDAQQLETRLREAVQTLACMAVAPGPKPPRSSWPEPLQSYYESYGHHAPVVRKARPTPDLISRYDEVADWLAKLRNQPMPSEDERLLWVRILWAKADRHSWGKITAQLKAGGVGKISESTVRRRWLHAMANLLRIANQTAAKREAA